jgi:hypothetical protein
MLLVLCAFLPAFGAYWGELPDVKPSPPSCETFSPGDCAIRPPDPSQQGVREAAAGPADRPRVAGQRRQAEAARRGPERGRGGPVRAYRHDRVRDDAREVRQAQGRHEESEKQTFRIGVDFVAILFSAYDIRIRILLDELL